MAWGLPHNGPGDGGPAAARAGPTLRVRNTLAELDFGRGTGCRAARWTRRQVARMVDETGVRGKYLLRFQVKAPPAMVGAPRSFLAFCIVAFLL